MQCILPEKGVDLVMENEKKINIVDEILEWIESILFSVFTVSLIFTFIFRPARVLGISMEPTLHAEDKLIMSNWFYTPKDKDIVVISSEGLNEAIVKRVIATEGQEVNIDFTEGKVYVDGVEQFEPYINNITTRSFVDEGVAAFEYPVTVPKDSVFVLGDNRDHSTDSRTTYVGFVPEKDILGHVIFRFYPFSDFGTLD